MNIETAKLAQVVLPVPDFCQSVVVSFAAVPSRETDVISPCKRHCVGNATKLGESGYKAG